VTEAVCGDFEITFKISRLEQPERKPALSAARTHRNDIMEFER